MWEKGQIVWCVLRGKGTVYSVTDTYVTVRFAKHGHIAYTLDGKVGSNFNRSLFFSEPKVQADEKPPFTKTLKKGEIVIVRQTGTGKRGSEYVVEEETTDTVVTQDGHVFSKQLFNFFRVGVAKIEFN